MEKKEIRSMILERRKMADADTLQADSLAICRRLMQMPVFQKASVIYVYMDCKGEVSTRPLLETAWGCGKRTAAPRVTGPGEMRYYYISSYNDVAPGYYGIPEPVDGLAQAREEDALVIVPGVAFDKMRHRCGYGQGFYDRYLQAHPFHSTAALAFAFQLVDEIPADDHDVRPQVLITEKEIYL